MPEMVYVQSSTIEAIGYDSDSIELHVRFLRTGITYVYQGVEEWRFNELMQTDSKGAYLNANIKPHYPYAKL